ncbi:MAG: hypothetical protein H7122_10805 [Chitinophagaceae bacterium]|nr:hypothetical protein [Chitinophagaceae bacterium]
MLSYALIVAFSYSIVLAMIIGLVRFRKIIRTYRPFILILILSFVGELLNTLLSYYFRNNALSANIYVLVECYLWLWQFYWWGAFKKKPYKVWLLVSVLTIIWMLENILMQKIWTFSSIFRISYAFVLIFLCIDQLNDMIVNERKALLRSSRFLICLGVVFFYSYKIMVEAFYLFELTLSGAFHSYLYYILVYMNLFVNLVFALAALWIPTRQRFTLPS